MIYLHQRVRPELLAITTEVNERGIRHDYSEPALSNTLSKTKSSLRIVLKKKIILLENFALISVGEYSVGI